MRDVNNGKLVPVTGVSIVSLVLLRMFLIEHDSQSKKLNILFDFLVMKTVGLGLSPHYNLRHRVFIDKSVKHISLLYNVFIEGAKN